MRALVGCSLGLAGCPQLLGDEFDLNPALPEMSLDSGGPVTGADAGTEPAGAAGAGGSSNLGGSGGALPLADASAAGASAGASPTADAGEGPPASTELGALLAHRYRFAGSGSAVLDEVGAANGTVVGTTVSSGSGKLSLSGNEQYVDLPNGLISDLESVTVEAWVNWLAEPSSPSAAWQNIFDFGSSGSEGAQGYATSRLYLAAQGGASGPLRAGYSVTDFDHEIYAEGSRALPLSSDPSQGTQVVLVADGAQGRLVVYIDGALEGMTSSGQAIDLSLIEDINDWLGRSQYAADPEFNGELLDLRIYSAPLAAEQVALSFSLGADADL